MAARPIAVGRCLPEHVLGRMKLDSKKGSARAGSVQHKATPLYFIDDTMEHKVHNGWLMAMLAAFRAPKRTRPGLSVSE